MVASLRGRAVTVFNVSASSPSLHRTLVVVLAATKCETILLTWMQASPIFPPEEISNCHPWLLGCRRSSLGSPGALVERGR